MSTCEEVLARLDDYVDGELIESEAQTLAAHLEQCPECRAEEAALRGRPIRPCDTSRGFARSWGFAR